ncbi:ferredoxin [Streptomyces boetiae]|uniref:ferredoxin n=1 Tax=Streptomyces boetiae TaxID=3075541 RepID=UPI00374E05F6
MSVDQDQCVGSGQCVQTLAEVFDQGVEDGLVVLLQESPSEELREGARRAAARCPGGAISIIE